MAVWRRSSRPIILYWEMVDVKKAYQNWLLYALCSILASVIALICTSLMGSFGQTAYVASQIVARTFHALNGVLIILALIAALCIHKNTEKKGTAILLTSIGLFAIVCIIMARRIALLYFMDSDVIEMCAHDMRVSGLILLISSGIAYVLHLSTKKAPWFIPMIIVVIICLVVVVGAVITYIIFTNRVIIASYNAIMIPFLVLLPALRIVNTGIQQKEYNKPNEEEAQIAIAAKSKVVSAILAFFLGTTGAHRYYLGYSKQGIIQTSGFVSLIIGNTMYFSMLKYDDDVLLFSVLFLLYGAAIGIWAFIDFIRILTGGLTPADGSSYTENQAKQVQIVQTTPCPTDGIEKLEKLAKLHEQGILTDEEFLQKKSEILMNI